MSNNIITDFKDLRKAIEEVTKSKPAQTQYEKQAEKMKAEMDKLQEQAGDKLVEAVSGGGMVKVTAKAKSTENR